MFGNGEICKCNPISETDLANFMLSCIEDKSKWNSILNVGGPDEGMTMKQQGELLFEVCCIQSLSLVVHNSLRFSADSTART